MPYTNLSILLVWVVVAVLIAVVLIYAPSGPGLVAIVVAALVTPALLLRKPASVTPGQKNH